MPDARAASLDLGRHKRNKVDPRIKGDNDGGLDPLYVGAETDCDWSGRDPLISINNYDACQFVCVVQVGRSRTTDRPEESVIMSDSEGCWSCVTTYSLVLTS
jgi:hypothetical protein